MGDQAQILVPLDGSRVAESALDVAARVASSLGACLLLLRVVEPISQRVRAYAPRIVDEIAEAELAEARGYLAHVVGRLPGGAPPVETRVVVGRPSESIVSTAERNRVDLVILTTHGHGGSRCPALGSVADRIVRKATVRVLLVRPAEVGEAEVANRVYAS